MLPTPAHDKINNNMQNSIINFDYKGSQISFEKGHDVMVNLTSMAKSFPEKNLTQIINSQEINDYCISLSKLQNYSLADLLIVRRGGNNNGTWAHRLVAIRVAQKLNSDFSVWVDMRIEELLTTGVATVSNDDEVIAYAMAVLNKRLEITKAEKERLQLVNEQQENELKIQAPKVEYHDKVLSSTGYLTVNMIAASLGVSDIKLNKLLCQWGVQYKESQTYYLYSKYRDKGYTVHKPHAYTDSIGNIKTRQHMYWTELGRKFIIELYELKISE